MKTVAINWATETQALMPLNPMNCNVYPMRTVETAMHVSDMNLISLLGSESQVFMEDVQAKSRVFRLQ